MSRCPRGCELLWVQPIALSVPSSADAANYLVDLDEAAIYAITVLNVSSGI